MADEFDGFDERCYVGGSDQVDGSKGEVYKRW